MTETGAGPINKVLVEDRGTIRVLTLNRPEVHNCVDAETAALLEAAITGFAAADGAEVLIVTGAGGKAFCSGADLKAAESLLQRDGWEASGPMGFARLDPGKPTIAAVEGYCFAGGMELAAWCDFRIAGGSAEFGALNRRWGVPFIDGGTQRFPRIMGLGNALYLIESGVRLNAQRALDLGLVQEVVETGKALERALELAAAITTYPQASLRGDRGAVLAGIGTPLERGLMLERDFGIGALADPAMAAGLNRFRERVRPDSIRG